MARHLALRSCYRWTRRSMSYPGDITQSTSISRVNFRIGVEKQTRQLRLRISTHYSYPLPNDQGLAKYGLLIQHAEAL